MCWKWNNLEGIARNFGLFSFGAFAFIYESTLLRNLRSDYIISYQSGQKTPFFADHIFNCIWLKQNGGIPIEKSLKYIPMTPIE